MDVDVAILTPLPEGVPTTYTLKDVADGIEFDLFLPYALQRVRRVNELALMWFYRPRDLDEALTPNSEVERVYGGLREEFTTDPSKVFPHLQEGWVSISDLFNQFGPELPAALDSMVKEMPPSVNAYLRRAIPSMGGDLKSPSLVTPLRLDIALKTSGPLELEHVVNPTLFFVNGVVYQKNPFIANPTMHAIFQQGASRAHLSFLNYLEASLQGF